MNCNLNHILERKRKLETTPQEYTLDEIAAMSLVGGYKFGYKDAKARIAEGKSVIPKKRTFLYE